MASFLRPILILTIAALWFAAPVAGQEGVLTLNGEGRAPIYQDDLDSARRRAVRMAQDAVIRAALARLLAEEWIVLYEGDLKRRVLARPKSFIDAFRVRKAETSLDRTQYSALVEAQVNRSRLVAELRRMSLPLLDDRKQAVALFYPRNDPILSLSHLREAALETLGARLLLLNLEIKGQFPVEPEDAAKLASPFVGQSARRALIRRSRPGTPAVLFLHTVPPPADEPKSGPSLKAAVYLVESGAMVASLEYKARKRLTPLPSKPEKAAAIVVAQLIRPFALQIQPGRMGDPANWGAETGRLELQVYGLRSVYDQETFEREFLRRDTPFEHFVLARLAGDSVTYAGIYTGARNRLESELEGKTVGTFRIRQVFWLGETLELRVKRLRNGETAELKPFPPGVRSPRVAALVQNQIDQREDISEFDPIHAEREDNGRFDRANPIMFDGLIYGHVDSRGEVDVFVADGLQPGETIDIEWNRMGRSNLNPTLRIYDQGGHLRKTLYLGPALQFAYRLPDGETTAYLELGDRFGYLTWDAGGYLNYHYLLRVHRRGAD